MHKLEIETTQNVAIGYPTASLVERIFAFLIDYAILIGYIIVVTAITDGFLADLDFEYYANVRYVLIIPVFVFYHFAFEYFNNGQSPGKRIRNLKVMKLDGSRPTLGSYFTRWLVGLIELYLFLGSTAMLSIMFTDKGQRIGDIAANTTVIKNEPLKIAKHITDRTFTSNYEVQFPKAKQFNDEQMQVVNSVLTNPVNHLRNKQIIQLADKIKTEYNIVDELKRPPKDFLKQLINDYAFIHWEEENKGQIYELQREIYESLT